MNVTLAIQLSGHLRHLCHSEQAFLWLENEVSKCRRYARCLVFLHTWDVLHPDANASTKLSGNATASSLPCVARIQSRISAAAILVESQPDAAEFVPSSLVGEPFSRLRDVRDVSPHAPGIAWLKTPDALLPLFLPPGRDLISLAGSHAMIHGLVAASRMRRQHCALFHCGEEARIEPERGKSIAGASGGDTSRDATTDAMRVDTRAAIHAARLPSPIVAAAGAALTLAPAAAAPPLPIPLVAVRMPHLMQCPH